MRRLHGDYLSGGISKKSLRDDLEAPLYARLGVRAHNQLWYDLYAPVMGRLERLYRDVVSQLREDGEADRSS